MGRPHKYRNLSGATPEFNFYHPHGLSEEQESVMTMYLSAEEFDALYLRHYENMKQTDAANQMEISQTTYSRILARAYDKLTKAFVEGYAISFQSHHGQMGKGQHRRQHQGGKFSVYPKTREENAAQVVFMGFGCQECGYEWSSDSVDVETSKTSTSKKKPTCPECNSTKTFRLIKKLTPENP